MTIAVTGASGRLGRRVAEILLPPVGPGAVRDAPADHGTRPGVDHAFPATSAGTGSMGARVDGTGAPAPHERVVLVTRRPSAVRDLADRGAVVREGDFDEPAWLAAAFAGADRMLLVSTDALERRVGQHRRAIEAAVAAGVGHVVYTSLSNPAPGNPVRLVTDAHRHTEEALVELAPRWTIVRSATYADALLPLWRQAAADGRLVTNQGNGCTAWVARDDCAEVAAAVLADKAGQHAGRTYDATGPALVGAADLADTLATWSGHPVIVDHVDDEAMSAHLVAAGLPADRAHLVTRWHQAIREGWFTQHTNVVRQLTGHPARPIADLVTAG